MQDADLEAPVRKRTRSPNKASGVSAGLNAGLNMNERVAVLESRLDYHDTELHCLQQTVNANFEELKASLANLSNRKNAVVEFISENWKVLLLFGAVFMGKDVSDLVHWLKAIGG